MRLPESLVPLVDMGIIEEVLQPLMSGKEAQLYLVVSQGEVRVAKVYKEATERSFKHRAEYTEGRKVRNSRRQRAMDKRSRYGREQVEEVWRSAEVDAIYRLRDAGVRVPEPYDFIDGVLVMELVADEEGYAAPRMVDLEFTREDAEALHAWLIGQVIRMLLAGVVHGDLSDFNVLMGADGPVIIDFPQVVDPAHNRNARMMLIRDVDNLTSFLARFSPRLRGRDYGKEMWQLYERNQLTVDTVLTGKYKRPVRQADTASVLDVVDAARRDAERRGLASPRYTSKPRPEFREVSEPPPEAEPELPSSSSRGRRRVVEVAPPQPPPRSRKRTRNKPKPRTEPAPQQSSPPPRPAEPLDDLDALLVAEGEPKKKRRRRRRRKPGGGSGGAASA